VTIAIIDFSYNVGITTLADSFHPSPLIPLPQGERGIKKNDNTGNKRIAE
jgi:hypothetical protein